MNELNIDLIIPYPNNPRKKANIDKIAASIKAFGFQQPIVIDNNNIVIVGHGRLMAAKKLGLKTAPVIKLSNLTEDQINAYRIADNRTNEESTWDIDLLKLEFSHLKELNFDLSLTGFDEVEILNLFKENEEKEDDVDFLDSDNVKTKIGDVFLLGNHRLVCGDCTQADVVSMALVNNRAILMVTDPPYGVNYPPEWRCNVGLGHGKRQIGKVTNDDVADWSSAYSLFPGDIIYVWHASIKTHVVSKNIEDCNFDLISQIIWNKSHLVLSRGDYHRKHEVCWYAVRKGKTHNWQGARDQVTVWDIQTNNIFGRDAKEMTGHSTQKPIECMLRPILNNTKQGDFVYDPFGGSGTTLIACERSERKCLMMEIEPKYCDIIINRWQKETNQNAILESNGVDFNSI